MVVIAAILDRTDLSYFLSTSHPDASYQVSSQLAFQFKRRSEDRFSRWPPYLGFLIYKSPGCFLYFKSTGILVQEKMRKTEWSFRSGSHLVHKNYFEIGPVALEEMLFQGFFIFSSGGHFVQRSGTI